MKIFLVSLGIFFLFVSGVFADYSDTQHLSITTDGVRVFRIDCGAGSCDIEGVEGMETIEVEAEIYIDNMSSREAKDFMDDYMVLTIRERGKMAELKSFFEYKNFSFSLFGNSVSYEINLKIKMPVDIALEIDDGSGDLSVRHIMADVEIDDGSGDMYIEDISGELIIDDGSGEMEITKVTGMVDIDDGSGDLMAETIEGDMEIEDGSGDIELANIIGYVDIDDGSGSIKVTKVDGSVAVDDGSGNIRINDITNDVKIIDDSSGRVSIADVGGDVYR